MSLGCCARAGAAASIPTSASEVNVSMVFMCTPFEKDPSKSPNHAKWAAGCIHRRAVATTSMRFITTSCFEYSANLIS
jgi:hypothetical protein